VTATIGRPHSGTRPSSDVGHCPRSGLRQMPGLDNGPGGGRLTTARSAAGLPRRAAAPRTGVIARRAAAIARRNAEAAASSVTAAARAATAMGVTAGDVTAGRTLAALRRPLAHRRHPALPSMVSSNHAGYTARRTAANRLPGICRATASASAALSTSTWHGSRAARDRRPPAWRAAPPRPGGGHGHGRARHRRFGPPDGGAPIPAARESPAGYPSRSGPRDRGAWCMPR
jgi:hypothetical protein